ncbi:MAG: dihydrofolate reductase [Pyrinomonadaceae bacterium]
MIIGIVAVAKNNAIGKDGKLPWHYSADLRFFKETTTGHAVVMGFNTWRAIRKPLPNRLNIVLSRSAQLEDDANLLFLRSKEQVIKLSEFLKCDIFIIGGAKTYAEFADVIEKWIVTQVPVDVEEADTYMPADFLDGFSVVETLELADGLVVEIFRREQVLV